MTKTKEKNNFSKFDNISKNFLIVSCVVLGSIFLASVSFMLTLIYEEKNENKYANNNTPTVQNMNLVSM